MSALSLSGFTTPWFFLYLVIIAAAVAVYVLLQRARSRRVLRFANMPLLEQVAAGRKPRRWRHLPAALLVAALALLTTAMAGPTHDVRIPRNRAVVMLVIDVSESMSATDVAPSRIEAARDAGKRFADMLTPGINLGLVKFSSGATLLVAPTTDHDQVKQAIDKLVPEPRTATGEGIFTALQAIATTGAVMGGGDGPPPARIVLESDGKETVRLDTDLLPCLATVMPAPAATNEATVEILNVPEPSPPVPHISIAAESSTEIRTDFRRSLANPTISSIVSPSARSATRSPAI